MSLDYDDLQEMTPADKAQYIKTRFSLVDVALQLFDLDFAPGNKITSPYNEADTTPSCHLYEDHFYDFSTGRGGDLIDLVIAKNNCTWSFAVRAIMEGVVRNDLEESVVRRSTPAPIVDLTPVWEGMICDGFSDWDLGRPTVTYIDGLFCNDVVAENSTGDLLIPHRHDGIITGIKLRTRTGRKLAVDGSVFSAGLYRTGLHDVSAHTAVIVEGESDCWALEEFVTDNALNVDVFALPGGAALWRDSWLSAFDIHDWVYTAFDNDHAGKQATEKVGKAIGWGKRKQLQVPPLFNDVREALAAGWQPSFR